MSRTNRPLAPWARRAQEGRLPAKSIDSRRSNVVERSQEYRTVADLQKAWAKR